MALKDAAVPSVRKTVTLVFADASGWTSLGDQVDAEEFQAVQARYFARCGRRSSGTAARSRSSSATR